MTNSLLAKWAGGEGSGDGSINDIELLEATREKEMNKLLMDFGDTSSHQRDVTPYFRIALLSGNASSSKKCELTFWGQQAMSAFDNIVEGEFLNFWCVVPTPALTSNQSGKDVVLSLKAVQRTTWRKMKGELSDTDYEPRRFYTSKELKTLCSGDEFDIVCFVYLVCVDGDLVEMFLTDSEGEVRRILSLLCQYISHTTYTL